MLTGMEAATVNLIYKLRPRQLFSLQAWDPQRHTCPYRADELLDELEGVLVPVVPRVWATVPDAEIKRIVAELRPLAVLGAASADWALVEQAKAWMTSHPSEAEELARALNAQAQALTHLERLCGRLGLPLVRSAQGLLAEPTPPRHTCPTRVATLLNELEQNVDRIEQGNEEACADISRIAKELRAVVR